MSCCNFIESKFNPNAYSELQYRKRYELLQLFLFQYHLYCYLRLLQYRKRYELLQRAIKRLAASGIYTLQYRKRYELLQLFRINNEDRYHASYNTASGMSCCNNILLTELMERKKCVTIPQAVWAVATFCVQATQIGIHNQLQYRKRYELLQHNFKKEWRDSKWELQYRKRYELLQHATKCSNTTPNGVLQYRKRYELLQQLQG